MQWNPGIGWKAVTGAKDWTLLTSWTKSFGADYLLPGEEPKPPILSDVFEVLTIESNDSGTDGTRGESVQNISEAAILTVLDGIGLTDSTVFPDDLFVSSPFHDEIKSPFDAFGWPTCLKIPTRSAQLLLLNLGGDASFSH